MRALQKEADERRRKHKAEIKIQQQVEAAMAEVAKRAKEPGMLLLNHPCIVHVVQILEHPACSCLRLKKCC
jgi:hypothetical protein